MDCRCGRGDPGGLRRRLPDASPDRAMPMRDAPRTSVTIATLGVAFLLFGLELKIFGPAPETLPAPFDILTLGGLHFTGINAGAFLLLTGRHPCPVGGRPRRRRVSPATPADPLWPWRPRLGPGRGEPRACLASRPTGCPGLHLDRRSRSGGDSGGSWWRRPRGSSSPSRCRASSSSAAWSRPWSGEWTR